MNAGAAKEPRTGEKSGFIQAPAFEHEEIRRASEQHLPQVARVAGRPAMGQTADRAVAAARSAVFISKTLFGVLGRKERAKAHAECKSRSEANTTSG